MNCVDCGDGAQCHMNCGPARFQETFCSQCGGEFGPGDSGFSHCDQHTKSKPMPCPLQKKYGDIICIDGTLWGLTYSECAPPDQRQALGPCEHCSRAKLNWRDHTAYPHNPDLDWT